MAGKEIGQAEIQELLRLGKSLKRVREMNAKLDGLGHSELTKIFSKVGLRELSEQELQLLSRQLEEYSNPTQQPVTIERKSGWFGLGDHELTITLKDPPPLPQNPGGITVEERSFLERTFGRNRGG